MQKRFEKRIGRALLILMIGIGSAHALAQGAGEKPQPTSDVEASISVNGVRNAAVGRGWPVIVEGLYSLGSVKGLIAKLKVTDSAGKEVAIPFERLAEVPADADGFVTVHWILSPEKSKTMTDAVEVQLELAGEKETAATSQAATIKWFDAPAEIPDAEYGKYMALLVRYDAIRDKSEDAAAKIAQWRTKKPKDVMPMVMSGDLNLSAGKLAEAAADYQAALKQWAAARPKGKNDEPPMELLERQRAVMAAMARKATKKVENSPDAQGKK
jgi:hypothetical protein